MAKRDWRHLLSVCVGLGGAVPSTVAAQVVRFPRGSVVRQVVIDPSRNDLTGISFIVMDRGGSIAIGQFQDLSVRFFGDDGRPLGSLGRSGAGPAEFRTLLRAGWFGDTLWVYDHALRRSTLIGPDRKFLRTELDPRVSRLTSGEVVDGVTLAGWGSGNRRLVLGIIMVPLRTVVAETRGDGAPAEIVWAAEPANCTLDLPGGKGFNFPKCARSLVVVAPTGGFVGAVAQSSDQQSRGEFTVTRTGPNAFVRSYRVDLPLLPKGELDSLIEAGIAKGKLGSLDAATVRRSVPRPARAPATRILVIGRDGSLWVGHSGATGATTRLWSVIGANGAPRYGFSLPANVEIMAAAGNSFWAVESDADGVETPVKYSIAKSPL